ncbi:MAG: sugar nucleotide-binding protein [Alphaproteobacteria bacterium]|nr:sugar nucleotide-binding protein [Alphaproteobacteria bacterium]
MFLIVGANGFLGSYLRKNILEMTGDDVLCVDIQNIDDAKAENRVKWLECNVTDIESVKKLNNVVKNEKDLKVIYLAVYFNTKNNLDLQTTKTAFNVNVIGLSNFLYHMENISRLYFTSTDMVFNRDGKYTEESPTEPMNQYGEHKIICEKIVNSFKYNVVRLSVMTGVSLAPDKKHFFDEILENLKNGIEMEFFADVYRTMIDFNTASRLIIDLINTPEAQKHKIVNISGDYAVSKYDLAIKIAEKYSLDTSKIIPVKQSEVAIWQEKRANEVLLDNNLLKEILRLKKIEMVV